MKRYRVVLVGCGSRGESHVKGFLGNPERFALVALCDLDIARLQSLSTKYGVARTYTSAEEMLATEKPDVLCFVTQPTTRLALVELGVRSGVQAIAFEKPMALGLAEARQIRDLCTASGVKAIVSHQQKYGVHWQRVKEIVDSGEIGKVHTIHATARGWLFRIATHIMDYTIWYNGGHRGEWVIGQAHGKRAFAESDPSPDYIFGQVKFVNGVRGIIECGTLSPRQPGDNSFWLDNGVTVYGTHGYARAITGHGWQALTRSSGGRVLSGPGQFDPDYEQPLYLRDLADWLDDPAKVHPCNVQVSYQGFEMLMGICLSCMERRKIDLPIDPVPTDSIIERLERIPPDAP